MYKDYEIMFSNEKGTKFTFLVGPYDDKMKKDLENLAQKYNAEVNVVVSTIPIDVWARDYFITLRNPDNTFILFVGKRYHGLSWDLGRDKSG